MSEEFDIIEIPFADLELSKTLEDEFLERRIATEIDQATDLAELKEAAKKLLQVTVARQAAIRGLWPSPQTNLPSNVHCCVVSTARHS